jgi:hypothetical protein
MLALDVKLIALTFASDANDAARSSARAERGNQAFGFPKNLSKDSSHRFRPNSNQNDKRLPSASV